MPELPEVETVVRTLEHQLDRVMTNDYTSLKAYEYE